MTKRMKIVCPDADSGDEENYATGFDRIRVFADLEFYLNKPETSEEFIDRIGDANGILLGWGLPDEVIQQAPGLEMLSFLGIGVGTFVNLKLAAEKNITVCNCPGYSDITVAEHCMALLLASCRHIPALQNDLHQGRWNHDCPAFELNGKTIGLIGFGGIGKQVARLCQAFGMNVLVWTRNMDPTLETQFGVHFCTLQNLYQQSDVISLHLSLTEDTEGLIDKAAFQQMQPGVVLINTARAEIVVEDAMMEALNSGHIRAAGLDVFHQEPLAKSHPLNAMNNVVISPHVGYNSPDAVDLLYKIGIDNIVNYFSGKPVNVVN